MLWSGSHMRGGTSIVGEPNRSGSGRYVPTLPTGQVESQKKIWFVSIVRSLRGSLLATRILIFSVKLLESIV